MADKSKIEWTDATWNPVSGCSKVSEGCRFCYAERMSQRFGYTRLPWTNKNAPKNVKLHEDRLEQPLRWQRPRRVFVNSMSDLFHEQVPNDFLIAVFRVMLHAPQHTFQILTKHPFRMLEFCTWYYASRNLYEIPKNIWLGVSCEDQETAYERIPLLLKTPAAIRFISAEPLLGNIDLKPESLNMLDWVIAGGESGPKARPSHMNWFRSLRDQCVAAKVPFFFKQFGEWGSTETLAVFKNSKLAVVFDNGEPPIYRNPRDNFLYPYDKGSTMIRVGKKVAGRMLDGRTWEEYPENDAQ